MKIAVASGKGGVGKSMVSSALAMLLSEKNKVVAADCDVDAPDLSIWLGERDWDSQEKISTSERAVIDYEKCISCGKCAEICRFRAIRFKEKPEVLPYLCEGCGACQVYCPAKAVELVSVKNGEIAIKKTKHGFPLVTGLLYPSETGSGKIVTEVKKKAGSFEHDIMVLDSAAGTGCPVIASLNGVDYAILVTEPTPSGFSDLQRVLDVVNHFKTPYGIIINKWNINKELSKEIEGWAGDKVLGKLSFDKKVFSALSNLTPILESDSVVADEIRTIFNRLEGKYERSD